MSSKVTKMRGNHDSKPAIQEKVNNNFWFSAKIEDWLPNVKAKNERSRDYRES